MDYYKILNCSKSTDENGIKKCYRKMALKYHPDKNPDDENAKQKFEEIQEAYEVLSDEKKRKIYDKFGYKGLKEYEENNFGNQHPEQKEQTVKSETRTPDIADLSLTEKIKKIVADDPDAGTTQIVRTLNSPQYGNVKVGWFGVRRILKQTGLDSKKKRRETAGSM